MTTEEVRRGSYKPLWFLIALCAFPYLAGTLYYQFKDALPGGGTTNYGTLVEPVREIDGIKLNMADGSERSFNDLRKKWIMLYVLDGSCDEQCQKDLYFTRQVRKAVADDRFRITRLMLLDNANQLHDSSIEAVIQAHPDLELATVYSGHRSRLWEILRGVSGKVPNKIMLVDPLGNFMMEYPADSDPESILKDVKRLLAVSRIG